LIARDVRAEHVGAKPRFGQRSDTVTAAEV
jgi:hypothetical protein